MAKVWNNGKFTILAYCGVGRVNHNIVNNGHNKYSMVKITNMEKMAGQRKITIVEGMGMEIKSTVQISSINSFGDIRNNCMGYGGNEFIYRALLGVINYSEEVKI